MTFQPDDQADQWITQSGGETEITDPTAWKSSILQVLNELLSASTFSRAKRLSQLLAYLVTTCADGHASLLNEYAIGLAVFNRVGSYNPGDDPIVRVQIGRLRQRLKDQYLVRRYSIHFDIPLGGYAVRFLKQGQDHHTVASTQRIGLRVYCIDADPQGNAFAEGLADELLYRAYETLPRAFELFTSVGSQQEVSLDYLATARLRVDPYNLRLTARLIGCGTGRLLWADQFDLAPVPGHIAAQQQLATLICSSIRAVLPNR